jgi:Ala-tRNA(Pro) deacylase
MAIALTLQQYLDDQFIDYDVMTHERTSTASQSAEASHVPGDCLAKGVVLSREGGFLIAVVPASCMVRLDAIQRLVQGPIAIAAEDEISELFPDCDAGAVPALAAAYGLQAIVDDSLDERADIYLEGSDHRSLIHMSGSQFRELLQGVPHGRITRHT